MHMQYGRAALNESFVLPRCPCPISAGSPVAALVGIVNVDYFRLVLGTRGIAQSSAYTAPGLAAGVAAGRVSYLFGLTGPAISVDTACSSALVALHVGASAVDRRECAEALACGANLALTPQTTMLFNQSGMMAQDGRCKTLDAAADGCARPSRASTAMRMLSGRTRRG